MVSPLSTIAFASLVPPPAAPPRPLLQDLAYLMKVSRALGMCCLIEVHTEAELARVLQLEGLEDHLLGINNRDLETFKVRLELGGWGVGVRAPWGVGGTLG